LLCFPQKTHTWWDSNPDLPFPGGCADHCATPPGQTLTTGDRLCCVELCCFELLIYNPDCQLATFNCVIPIYKHTYICTYNYVDKYSSLHHHSFELNCVVIPSYKNTYIYMYIYVCMYVGTIHSS
jgi:hypothetical protein